MTPRMVIKAENGNVGIGVTSPTYNLEVSGSGYISGSLTVAGTITAQKLNVQQVTSSVIYSSGSNIFGNNVANTQTFTGSLQVTGSTHYLLGNVGINNTSPAYSLDISGTPTNAILNLAKSDGDQFLRFIGGSGGANQLIQTSYNLGIDVGGAGSRAITIISGSGNVAQYAAEKVMEFGGKVVTFSDSDGFIYDPKGVDNEKLLNAFGNMVDVIIETQFMSEAVKVAYKLAEAGDNVLLSPACASFDLFENYEDRGRQFKSAIRNL